MQTDRPKKLAIMHWWYCMLIATFCAGTYVSASCPWSRDVYELQCACSYNLAQELTVQCNQVNFTTLMDTLNEYAESQTVDLLYVHNSSINEIKDNVFSHVSVNNIQMSKCEIRRISARAFQGQEESLKNLNLQDNLLTNVPSEALRQLKQLALLDLSANKISRVPDDAFATLRLTTLKLADNNITLTDNSFRGLENSLKNLNLKNTRLRHVPNAVRHLTTLSFLDLAHNNIRNLTSGVFANLHSLTALNLERNFIQHLEPDVFSGVNDTLSSLSLLNNIITEFPKQSLASLTELRVLDVGFNSISILPKDAFKTISSLTLLALDGNPLPTLPKKAFLHLNGSLRGLSLGGRFLECDCKIRWIAEWIQDSELQVTSRERNPQFCGKPNEFKNKTFYHLGPDDFQCSEEDDTVPEADSKPVTTNSVDSSNPVANDRDKNTRRNDEEMEDSEDYSTDEDEIVALPPHPPTSTSTTNNTVTTAPTTKKPFTPPTRSTSSREAERSTTTTSPTNYRNPYSRPPHSRVVSKSTTVSIVTPTPPGRFPINVSRPRPFTQAPIINNGRPGIGRPSIVVAPGTNAGYTSDTDHLTTVADPNDLALSSEREVIVQEAVRQDTTVDIHWGSDSTNILGFRVVYRLFGDNIFQLGPPLAPNERSFKIKNVPTQEALVVCVVSLEESTVTPETVPFGQCREIRTETPASTQMDKIIIAASAAICGTVVVAVVIFICCNRRRAMKSEKLRLSKVLAPTVAGTPNSLVGSQVTNSMTNVGNLGIGMAMTPKDWDQLSMYSSRSIPRARMYQSERPGSVMGSVNGGYIQDDARSHVSGYSISKAGANLVRSRSLADGQSQRSMSAMSGRYILTHNLHGIPINMGLGMGIGVPNMGIGLSRTDLRGSQRSLADMRMSELGSRASRASRSSRTSQYSSRRSEQIRRRLAQEQNQRENLQQHQTTGDESSWETDRDRGSNGRVSRHPQMGVSGMANDKSSHRMDLMRAGLNRSLRASGRAKGDMENWIDHDMDIYMAHNTMRNDLVRL